FIEEPLLPSVVGMLFSPDLVMQFSIYQYPSAMFADDNFFPLLNFSLALRRNDIKAATAGIANHRHNRQSVPEVFPDPGIRMQQAFFNLLPGLGGFFFKLHFF